MGFRVYGLGLRVEGLPEQLLPKQRLEVPHQLACVGVGVEVWIQGLGFRVEGLWFRV